ncbi:hypothetical protein [Paraburkholderia lycopersici]|nr:hypothetical protein [Paraburkholderia lycopersici]
MSNRAAARSGTRTDGARAAIADMDDGAPRIQPRRSGGQSSERQGRGAAKGSRCRKQPLAASPPASGRARVEVVFYKEILDHRGLPHRCELMRVSGESVERAEAIACAIFEFEQAQCVSHWTIAADGYEVETQST